MLLEGVLPYLRKGCKVYKRHWLDEDEHREAGTTVMPCKYLQLVSEPQLFIGAVLLLTHVGHETEREIYTIPAGDYLYDDWDYIDANQAP